MFSKIISTAALAMALLGASVAADCTVTGWSNSDCTGDSVATAGYTSACHTLGDGRAIRALQWSADCSGGDNTGLWASTNCDGARTEYNVGSNAGRCQAAPAGRFSFGCDHC